MSPSPLRTAFNAVRPLRQAREATTYMHLCRMCRARLSTAAVQRLAQPLPMQVRSASASRAFSRNLTSTSRRSATVALQNPRTDEDGAEMTINISDRAAQRLRQITSSAASKNTLASSSSNTDAHLRVTVTSGGCHGFQYLMSLEPSTKIDRDEDTVFEYTTLLAEGDTTGEYVGKGEGKAEVVMDSASLELLKGSTVDFTQELIGSQFKIVGNPRATSSCGCGTSFDIE